MTDHRMHARLYVPKYYRGGCFHLIDGERRYYYISANDVCVEGIGLDIPSPVEHGSRVEVGYKSEVWQAGIDGTVMWCARSYRVGRVSLKTYPNFRVGIRLNPDNSKDNALLYFTLKDGIELGVPASWAHL